MSGAGKGIQPSDLDLRIKAGAALTCELSARVGTGTSLPSSAKRITVYTGSAQSRRGERLWRRRIIYLAFAIAITIPWVLLLVGQFFE
jgi:hypothetical protein